MVAVPPEEDRGVTQNVVVGLAVTAHILENIAMIKEHDIKMTQLSRTGKGEVTTIAGPMLEISHHYLKISVRLTILIMYFTICYLFYLHLMMLIRLI